MKQTVLQLAVCFIGLTLSVAFADEGNLTFPDHAGSNVELSLQDGLVDREASEILQIFVGSPDRCCEGKTPIAGNYHLADQRIIFDPAFDFIAGQQYTVQSHDKALTLTGFVVGAEVKFPNPEVLAIYPSGDDIPENTLRFYIQFSAPMTPHRADDFIKLVDANGSADTAAFMMFTQELWSEDRTRLTVLMDPGRIKRGVAQNLALGPALREGDRYSIVIDEGWPSARGGQSAPRFEKPFVVSAALRQLPDTRLWQFQKPKANTSDPLVILFDRLFDQQLAHNAIVVRDDSGRVISGTVSVEENERTWRFQPDSLWQTSVLQVVVNARLEDVAGNNFRDLLDHSVETDMQAVDHEVVILDLMTSD